MKYIVSEKHLRLLREAGRVDYLKNAFGVFEPEDEMEDVNKRRDVGAFIKNGTLLAQVKVSKKGKKGVSVSQKVFTHLTIIYPCARQNIFSNENNKIF